MSQKDIQAIANQMNFERKLQESEKAKQKRNKILLEKFQEKDDELYEQYGEKVDLNALGFGECDVKDDASFDEEEYDDHLNDNVEPCLEQEEAPEVRRTTLTLSITNEDGFASYFIKDIQTKFNLSTSDIKIVKSDPSTSITEVEFTAPLDTLKELFACYLSAGSFDQLSQEEQNEFNDALVFDDDDTIDQVQYRADIAHMLEDEDEDAEEDEIDSFVNEARKTSTKRDIQQIVKEELVKRKTRKIADCINEGDFSDLSDDDLKDYVNMLNDPEAKKHAMSLFKTSYKPTAAVRHEIEAQKRRDMAFDTSRAERGAKASSGLRTKNGKTSRGTWHETSFSKVINGMSEKDRKDLMVELISDAQKTWANNPSRMADEIMFIRKIFGMQNWGTEELFGQALGLSPAGFMRYEGRFFDVIKKSFNEIGAKSSRGFMDIIGDPRKEKQFREVFAKNMQEFRKHNRNPNLKASNPNT